MRIGFEWDPAKAIKNLAKHGVSFDEAATVFDDTLSRTIDDVDHSGDEARFITMGMSNSGNLLVVCHCDRPTAIRIISCWPAEPAERRWYESDPD